MYRVDRRSLGRFVFDFIACTLISSYVPHRAHPDLVGVAPSSSSCRSLVLLKARCTTGSEFSSDNGTTQTQPKAGRASNPSRAIVLSNWLPQILHFVFVHFHAVLLFHESNRPSNITRGFQIGLVHQRPSLTKSAHLQAGSSSSSVWSNYFH